MFGAHPDDEAIFGFSDLFYNDVHVICMTSGYDKVRRGEFEECAEVLKFKGDILSYRDAQPDSKRDPWRGKSDRLLFLESIRPLLRGHYDLVVSHDEQGEYGHVQHVRVHHLATYVAANLGIPFETFRDRWHIGYTPELVKRKYEVLSSIYQSQRSAVRDYLNYYEPR